MPLFLIGALILTILAALFAIQNAVPVTVTFLLWNFEGSLALILLSTFGLGIVASLIVSVPSLIRKRRELSSHRRKIEELERSLVEKSRTYAEPRRP